METSNKLSTYMMTLTDRKAFTFFLLSFIAGIIILATNFYIVFLLPGVVICYAIFLFYCQNRFFVSLGIETKNSPYFLGFLFTLSCLIKIFLSLPDNNFTGQSGLFSFLVPQIGAALSTTVFGLIGRYLIISYDPGEKEQQDLWRLATEDLKENATTYQKSQRRLMDLIDDFVNSHNEILEQEEKASRRHIDVLSETSAVFERLSEEYPEKIKGFLLIFDAIQGRFDDFIDKTLPKIHSEMTEGTSFQLEKLFSDFIKISKSSFTSMTNNLSGLEQKIGDFNQSFELTFNGVLESHNLVLKDSADQLNNFQNNYIKGLTTNFESINHQSKTLSDNIKETAINVQHCNTIFEGKFTANLDHAGEQLKEFSELSHLAKAVNEDVSDGLVGQIKSFDQIFSDRLNTFQSEIKQIDSLIDCFINTTRKKLSN